MFQNTKSGLKKTNKHGDAYVLLLIKVPRTNDKKELSAEQMFAALHGILEPKKSIFDFEPVQQEYIGFEIISVKNNIYFYAWIPKHLQNFVEGQIYAQYSAAQIFKQENDYALKSLKQKVIHIVELSLDNDETIPIKTFPSFEVDPLSGITASLARLKDSNEEMWIQILARPIDNDWHKKSKKHISKIKSGPFNISHLVKAPFQALNDTERELSERDKSRIRAIEEKSIKLGYQAKIRLVYLGSDKTTALYVCRL